MAIEVLGKSLLSAARKKNKRKQKIGSIAALAYVGMSKANSLIRKKAVKRAKEFEDGLLPLETALNGEYLRIEKAKTKYNDIMKQKGETGTVREVFSNAEKTRLQKLVNASATTAKYNDEELNQLAFNDSQDEYDAWVNDTETYKPFFDVKKDDYFKNFKTLKAEGTKYIEDDSLSRRFNKRFGLGDEEKMIEAKIAFDNAEKEELVLSLPERLHKQLDIPFLQQLNKIKIREMSYDSVKTATKLYNEDGEIEILMNTILAPKETKPTKESKIEPRITTAWNQINDIKITNDFNMADITFAATDLEGNNVTSVMSIKTLKKSLKLTRGGQPIDKTDLNVTNDWDSITQGALQQAQLLYLNQVKNFPGVVITEPMFREFVSNGLRQSIAANVVLLPKVEGDGMFGGGGMPETARLTVVNTQPPPSEETLAETFIKTVEANGEDIKSDKIQNQLLKLIQLNPETKDALTPFIINKSNVETLKNIITVDNLENVNIVVGKTADGSDINWSNRPIINKIIEVESTGRINEISNRGAKGLMQIKDATADNPGMGVPPAVRDEAGNISPEENVIFGTNYFDALTKRYNGDLVTAAMAYNAGMGTIDKWIEEGRNYNDLRTETQNYVGKIFGTDIQELVKAGTYGQDITQTPTETTTSSSLLDPKETVETETSSSLLSQDKVYRKYSEIMADDSLSDIQKEDELSERVRDEFRQSLKNIPPKMRLRAFNQTKKRADKFLEGKTSGFYSTEFTKWKRENNITTNYKTSKDEYKKYVEEFLEDLENQINSV